MFCRIQSSTGSLRVVAGGRALRVWYVCAAMLLAAVVPSTVARAQEQVRRCARCDGAIVENLKVVVTDFAERKETLCCNVACAIGVMDGLRTARAVAHDPFAGKEVRIIRTGEKWVVWPKPAVFLYLPIQRQLEPPGADAKSPQGGKAPANGRQLDPAYRCLAFPRQVEYVQYLATHPEVAAFKPRPLRLPDLLAAIKKQDRQESSQGK